MRILSVGPVLIQPGVARSRPQGRYAPRKRGGLRPSLTAAARDALGSSGRDEETALFSRTKKHPRWGARPLAQGFRSLNPRQTARRRKRTPPTRSWRGKVSFVAEWRLNIADFVEAVNERSALEGPHEVSFSPIDGTIKIPVAGALPTEIPAAALFDFRSPTR